MSQSCRNAILKVWKDSDTSIGTNAGLLKDRYLKLLGEDDKDKGALNRLQDAIRDAVVQTVEVYQMAYTKYLVTVAAPKEVGIFKTNGRLIIGLGGESVLETGLTLQHTYGTPIVPGSALKGLVAHYCDQVYGASDEKFKLGGEYHETIFGTTRDSGHIIFYDAWITPESLADSLKQDVMTPHHSDYYSKKNEAAPTDFDDPKPISFLSITGNFYVAVSCDVINEAGEKWTKLAFKMLTEALRDWGIGGKTNAGYGRLMNVDQAKNNIPGKESESPLKKPTSPDDPGPDAPVQPMPTARNPNHIRGEILEVTRIADPKVKRGKPYFMADDGIGGLVPYGNPPSIELGQKTRLKVEGVMKEGYYVFAAISSEAKSQHQKKGGKK